jgi:diadenylate cyclase
MLVPVTVLDVIDIVLVAFIFYQLYRIIKGTAAFSIFLAVFMIYVSWLIVKALNMELISSLLGQVIGVGVIALIIVFQQEVRRFLLVLGNRYIQNSRFSFKKLFGSSKIESAMPLVAEEIVKAVESMAGKKTGALIVIGRQGLTFMVMAVRCLMPVSAELLESIFFKNTPLHDGAVLIEDNLILAAACPLPVTDQFALPSKFGMRHRAAIGISEHTDALVIVVSEETGHISVVDAGVIRQNVKPAALRNILLSEKVW